MKMLLLVYLVVTGTYGCIAGACYDTDGDKQIVYSILGIFLGWLIIPIKFIRGVYKIIDE